MTRYTGQMLDLPPLMLYDKDGHTTGFADVDASWVNSFRHSAAHFVDALVEGRPPEMDGYTAIRVLQLCFAVYQASMERGPVDPASIDGSVSPPWWPPFG